MHYFTAIKSGHCLHTHTYCLSRLNAAFVQTLINEEKICTREF